MLKAFKYFILLFFTTISLVSLSSCNDNDGSDIASSDIVGRWILSHYSFYSKENGITADSWDEDHRGSEISFVFKQNGVVTVSYADNSLYHESWEGSWKIDGKNLYLDFPNDAYKWWNIQTLTSNRLIISRYVKEGKHEDYDEVTLKK